MEELLNKTGSGPKPEFLKSETRRLPEVVKLRELLRSQNLHTVCEQANCPNLGRCFSKKISTFMILGKVCTRSCAFCAVEKGKPAAPDPAEPEHLAQAAAALGLAHVVITSVTRDDLPDGGARQFYESVAAAKKMLPGSTVEVLTPDFMGDMRPVGIVLEAKPDVYNHNLETAPSLYPRVRPGADYHRSLGLIEFVGKNAPSVITKSGIMAGMGETKEEIIMVMKDLVSVGCRTLTIGQYLAPSRRHWPVAKYYEPWEYEEFKEAGLEFGFDYVFAGPLVRSSFSAGEVFARFKEKKL